MTAAKGPPCEGCGKRVSARRVTRCPWCRRVLCLACVCPARCAQRATANASARAEAANAAAALADAADRGCDDSRQRTAAALADARNGANDGDPC